MKKLLLGLFAIAVLPVFPQGAIHVNRVFQDASGNPVFNPILNPFGIQWSKSITSPSGELITVGHTNISGQGENIFLIKYDPDGNIIFQTNYNTSSTQNDYGTSVTLDGSGNIYVCGATDNGGSTNYDVVVLKYNSSGTLQNSTTYAGGSGLNDVGTDIAVNGAGLVFVSAANENTTTGYDYLLLKFNSALSLQASGTYDYAGLNDIPGGIELNGTDVFVFGASANSLIDWDYATAKFDQSCNYGSDTRNSISGVGFDQPLAFKKDASGNMYITGKATTGAGTLDILTVKISPSFVVLWSVTYNGYGLDDVGSSLVLDGSGNVIVGGFATKTNNKTEMVCIKYNGSNGSLIWTHKQSAENGSGDAYVKGMSINPQTGAIYFIGGENGSSGFKQVVVGRMDGGGNVLWQKKIQSSSSHILPSDLEYGTDGLYAISILDSVTKKYIMTKYEEMEFDTLSVYNANGQPYYKQNELIVKFVPSALDTNAINNTIGTANMEFADLKYFMTPTAYAQVTAAINESCRECGTIKAVKIFPGLPSTLKTTTSRLGETISIPDFWTTLLLIKPSGLTLQQFYNTLSSLSNVVTYAQPNFIALAGQKANSSGNCPLGGLPSGFDPYYHKYQRYLKDTTGNNYDINVEQAWSIFPEGGRPSVSVGVFDTGLDWSHEDFGYDGINPLSTKVIQGWSFQGSGQDLKTIPNGGDVYIHGTDCAGIIGAVRNNNKGIKGIAGGNDSIPFSTFTKGVSLYGLKIGSTNGYFTSASNQHAMNYMANAIVESALFGSPPPMYRYGLNLGNHSWLIPPGPGFGTPNWNTDYNNQILTEAVHTANRAKVTFVTATGNALYTNPAELLLPAKIDDDWVISVGGTGTNGKYADFAASNCNFTANRGKGIDLAAPGFYLYDYATEPGNTYCGFGGTSGATPMVSGAAALLMSYLNNPNNPNDPINLAPEDCEQILELTTTKPSGGTYPNDSIGYGRLNVGKALKFVEKPDNTLWHFNTHGSYAYSLSKLQIGTNDTVKVPERWMQTNNALNYLLRGKYVVNTWRIRTTVTHNIPTTDSIKAYWPRPSSSEVWGRRKGNTLYARERDSIISCNNSQAVLEGFIYEVKDTLTGTTIGWWPFDTSLVINSGKTMFAYTVVTIKKSALSISKNKIGINNSVQLFPNPTRDKQKIVLESNGGKILTIDLFDITGRQIKRAYSGISREGKTELTLDVAELPSSLYLYYINLDGEMTTLKFIKE